MPYCGPTNAIPSCPATRTVGFGSGHSGFGSGLGYGGVGGAYGGSASAASLGVLEGGRPHCINQLPPSEVMIQPPPVVVTIPGPILSATPYPLEVGGYAPCALPGSRSGFGSGRFGYSNLGLNSANFGSGYSSLGSGGHLGHRGSVALDPCYDVCH